MGVALASNLLTLFVFYEVLTLSTYPLVAHAGTPEAIRGARTYLGILLATSIGLFLPAILWTYSVAGTLDFRPGGVLAGHLGPVETALLLGLFVLGIGKAAVMPVHRWLPAAMVAPTPVSALLHAVAVVKAGVFTITKVVIYIFGLEFLAGVPAERILVYVAGFTVVASSIVALRQDNLKRLLAYSTIGQLSYIVLAAMVLTPLAEIGAAIHMVAHGVAKITLFFTAGAIYVAAGKTRVSELDGIAHRMPWTLTAFAVGALSMVGVPPTAGFVSKWYIIAGAFQNDLYFVLRGAHPVHGPQRGVLPADHSPGVLPARDGGAEVRPRRGALAHGRGTGVHGHPDAAVLLLQRAGRGPGEIHREARHERPRS